MDGQDNKVHARPWQRLIKLANEMKKLTYLCSTLLRIKTHFSLQYLFFSYGPEHMYKYMKNVYN